MPSATTSAAGPTTTRRPTCSGSRSSPGARVCTTTTTPLRPRRDWPCTTARSISAGTPYACSASSDSPGYASTASTSRDSRSAAPPDRVTRRAASTATVGQVHIVSALFVDDFSLREAPGPSTRIDLNGVFFSMASPTPVPVTPAPHLVALVWCPPSEQGQGVLEVVFRRDGEQIA